jgi:DNA-binding MarR family transcriptional regulator
LIRRGYASRRADPQDGRSALMVLTPRGERLHDAIVPLRQAMQRELEAPLTRSEIAELHRILDKLMEFVAERLGAGSARARRPRTRNPRPRGTGGRAD